jgi:ligand-binding sensor domain-containing protein/serine phosphatase RsbU (regulator of sigma subunit)
MRALYLSFILLFSSSAYGQLYNFDHYSLEHGLAQSQVQCMMQDSRGYLWFGTLAGGASRWDGKKFTAFNESNGLANNRIYTMLEDRNKNLWFGTRDGGLTKYDGTSFTHIDTSNGLPHQKVWCSLEDSRDNLWFGTLGGGLVRINQTDTVTYNASNGLHTDRVRHIFEASDGTYWVGGNSEGVLQLDENYEKKRLINMESGLKSNKIFSVEEGEDGVIWLGSLGAGLHRIQGDSIAVFNTENGLTNNTVRCLAKDGGGRLWIGTDDGISIYDGESFTNMSIQNGLENNRIKSLLLDDEGNMWVGYDGDGTARFLGERFLHVSEPQVLETPTWAIGQDTGNNMWFGTLGNGAFRFKGDEFQQFTESEGLPNRFVSSILRDRNGNMWFGCKGGKVAIFDGKNFEIMQAFSPGLFSTVSSLFEDRRGHIWMGGSRSGAVEYDGEKLISHTSAMKEIWSNGGAKDTVGEPLSIYNITQDPEGLIWMCGGEGLFSFNGTRFTHYDTHDGLSQIATYSLTTDKAGGVWIGTAGGGVNRYYEGYFTQLTMEDGLSSNSIWLLVFDDEYNLWVGTEKGVDCVAFARTANNRPNFNHVDLVRHYGLKEGFSGMETSQNTAFKDAEGYLWFATIKGITRYNPQYDNLSEKPPRTYITGLRLFLQPTDWSAYTEEETPRWHAIPPTLELPYDKNHLSFDFVALHHSNPSKVTYSYKLEGLDAEWSPYLAKNDAVYASLPPGEYTFMVKSCTASGKCNIDPVSWSFTISSPFWGTWWFYAVCGLFAAGLVAAVIKRREYSFRKQRSILQTLVEMRTAELEQEKGTVELQNRRINSSINYAKRIQDIILPDVEMLNSYAAESFVYYKPRDIVSGDFYWFSEQDGVLFVAAADCTGHGVPGALMSMIGNGLLTEIIVDKRITDPAEILSALDAGVMQTLKQHHETLDAQEDGLDITLCRFSSDRKTVTFAGANHFMYHISNGELQEYEGSIFSIGGIYGRNRNKSFENVEFNVQAGDCLYMMSDGYPDQFGGLNNKKFMTVRLQKLLLGCHQKPMHEQHKVLQESFHNWKGVHKQVDDVLIVGMRI